MCHVPTPKISIQQKTGDTIDTPLINRNACLAHFIRSATRLARQPSAPEHRVHSILKHVHNKSWLTFSYPTNPRFMARRLAVPCSKNTPWTRTSRYTRTPIIRFKKAGRQPNSASRDLIRRLPIRGDGGTLGRREQHKQAAAAAKPKPHEARRCGRSITCGGGRRRHGDGAIPRAVPVRSSIRRRRRFSSSRDAASALLARHLYTTDDGPAEGRRVGCCFWRTAAGKPPDPRLREYARLALLPRCSGGGPPPPPLAFGGG